MVSGRGEAGQPGTSSGVDTTQQAILDALHHAEHGKLTAVALAKRVGGDDGQILDLVQALEKLEKRGRVFITREHFTSERASTATWGDVTIDSDVRLVGTLRPLPPVLMVWLPESRARYVSDCLSTTAARGGSGSPELVAEYERLSGRPSPTRRAIRRLPYRSRKRYPEFKPTQR